MILIYHCVYWQILIPGTPGLVARGAAVSRYCISFANPSPPGFPIVNYYYKYFGGHLYPPPPPPTRALLTHVERHLGPNLIGKSGGIPCI